MHVESDATSSTAGALVVETPRKDDQGAITGPPSVPSLIRDLRGTDSRQVWSTDTERATPHLALALIQILGDLPDDMHDTPRRVVRAWQGLMIPDTDWTFTRFLSDRSQMVLVRDIPFASLCAHHLLPFAGVAHVAYIPNGYEAGLSKIARTVKTLAQYPQVQEQLTDEIARMIGMALETDDTACVISARHTCMEIRGAHCNGAVTVTSALRGEFLNDAPTRSELMGLVR
jgi:GTP cyclohydrolase I